jgi:N-acetylglucosaminyl-diphospho-decaprenol L-rhamnosyltransferase
VTAAATAVAVVNHNTRDHLRRCLESVLREEPAQTIVVDTGSGDGSAEMVRREFPAVDVHEMENKGYGAGANVAFAATAAEYVLVLNADTWLQPGAVAALADYLSVHPRAALAGPRIVDDDDDGLLERTARRFPTPLELLLQETGLHALLNWRREPSPRQVDWVLGAALAIRREAFASVGGFDESYFMYGEEVDLCLRLRRAEWEVHYAPVATVVHVGAASTSQRRAEMAAEYVRSVLMLYRRHKRSRETALARTALGLALSARLVRDSFRLLVAPRRPQRQALAEQVDGWRRALGVTLRDRGR